MTKIAIVPNAAGTGTFTIEAPNSNSNRTLTLPDAAGEFDTLQRAGNVLQVLQAATTTVSTVSAGATLEVVTQTITPTSASSRFLVMVYTSLGNSTGSPNTRIFIRRAISGGATTDVGSFTDGTRKGGLSGVEIIGSNLPELMENVSAQFIDAPATTSAITYGLVVGCEDGGIVVNRVGSTTDAVWATRTHSTIIVMEIAG
jgi:hypothetical protein